jgi:hypothetical protein
LTLDDLELHALDLVPKIVVESHVGGKEGFGCRTNRKLKLQANLLKAPKGGRGRNA